MRIIQLSTRLSEGGAAGVARQLHENLLGAGLESHYAYGYGKSGRPSPMEATTQNCLQLSSSSRAALNLLAFRFTGKDLVGPTSFAHKNLLKLMKTADIVHIHGVHSYFYPLELLIEDLHSCSAQVLITMHDNWAITGRCAFTEGCRGWEAGCRNCPTLQNYPPVYFDNAYENRRQKFAQLASLGRRLNVTSPAEHVLANFAKSGAPGTIHKAIPNAYHPAFKAHKRSPKNNRYRLAFVCASFMDTTKYPPEAIAFIAQETNAELVFIGEESWRYNKFGRSIGPTRERAQLAKHLSECDGFVFLSQKDIFPLVLIEALIVGLKPFCITSPAADEVLAFVGQKSYQSLSEMIAGINKSQCSEDHSDLSELATEAFSPSRFFDGHTKLYKQILSERPRHDTAQNSRL